MRTTVTLADDVAAAVEQRRRTHGIGISGAVNDLVRAGLTANRPMESFQQTSHDLGAAKIDLANIGEASETLDGPSAR